MFSTCHFHYNKRLSHYCPAHDEVVCERCLPESHKECRKVQPIEKVADSLMGPVLSTLESRVRHLKEVLIEVLRLNADSYFHLNQQKQVIRKNIKHIRKSINAHLDKVENDLVADLMEKFNSSANVIGQERTNLLKQKETLEEWNREIIAMKNHASNVSIFSMAKQLLPQQKASEIIVQRHLTEATTINLDFESSRILQDLKIVSLSFGRIVLKESPSYITAEQKKRMMILPPPLHARPVISKSLIPTISKFETSVFGTNIDVIRGCFLPDDRLLIPDSTKNTLFVCRMDGSNVKRVKLKCKPRDATLMDQSRALVTCGDLGILIFDIRTLSPGSFINTGGHCSAITCADNKIFVANGECKISVLNSRGQNLKVYTTKFDPYMIASSPSGVLYYTNYNNNQINCILTDGKNQTVYKGLDLRESTGIAVDSRQNVFVAGCDSSNIVKLSRSDKTTKTVYAKQDGINSPLGIALSLDKSKLMVINNYKQIKIYKANIT